MSLVDLPSASEIVEIGEAFLDLSFPGNKFHHREHLIMVTYLLIEYPDRDWATELPDRIKAFNVANGGINNDTSGYHHTITMAFLMLVKEVLALSNTADHELAVGNVLFALGGERDLLLRFYSKDRLFSRDARLEWLGPDIREISVSATSAI